MLRLESNTEGDSHVARDMIQQRPFKRPVVHYPAI